MAAHADTAAQGKPVQECDDRLGEIKQGRDHAVFVPPELITIGVITCYACRVHVLDITARTKGFVTRTIDNHEGDGAIIGPIHERGFDRQTHVLRHRVESVGTVQRDAARVALCADVNARRLIRHKKGPCRLCRDLGVN